MRKNKTYYIQSRTSSVVLTSTRIFSGISLEKANNDLFLIQRWFLKGILNLVVKTEWWNLGRRTKQCVIPTEAQQRGEDEYMEETSEH